ncbi:MAG: hypothetical protein HQ562_05900 [Candidatus Marinimicrobia bacterium]|nr:hypothetical protein [Candidatus Neomarinimicrobiota bacterium]NQT97255.1 hypothetical protein [Candidatus Neomarinimicrobiota bacterium]
MKKIEGFLAFLATIFGIYALDDGHHRQNAKQGYGHNQRLDTYALLTFVPGLRVIAWYKFSFNCWPATVYISDSCCAKT